MLVIAALAAFIPAPVFAQLNDLIKQEGYYAPTTTVVQSATPQEFNEFRQIGYYAPTKTLCSNRPRERNQGEA